MIGDTSSSSLYIKTCPACGGEVPRAARRCTFCGYPLEEEGKERRASTRSEALTGVALGLALAASLISVALLAGVLLHVFGVSLHLFYALVSLLLVSLLAARQRYGTPTFWQNLVTLIIGAVPLLGSAYVLYHAARRLSRFPALRRSLYGVLLVSGALLVFLHPQEVQRVLRIPEWRLPTLALRPLQQLQLTLTPMPSATQAAEHTPTHTPQRTPTNTGSLDSPAPLTSTPASALEGCLSWDEVNMAQVGEFVCVYGDYLRTYQKEDGVYVLAFSDLPGSFQVWSFPKSMQAYLANISGTCVVVQGWLQTSGVRPIIILKTSDTLTACP